MEAQTYVDTATTTQGSAGVKLTDLDTSELALILIDMERDREIIARILAKKIQDKNGRL